MPEDNIAKPTVGDIINAVVSQISMAFPDQDREATAADTIVMLQTMMAVVKAYVHKGEIR